MSKSLTVRNVDDALIAKLKLRAARHRRSAEAEAREILTHGLANEPREDFWSISERLRAATADRSHTPAEILVREGRDER